MNTNRKLLIVEKIQGFLERCELPEMLLLRVLTAFFSVSSAVNFVMADRKIDAVWNWQEYISAVPFWGVLLTFAYVFAVLCVVCALLPKRLRIFDPILTLCSVLIFDLQLLLGKDNLYLTIGVMLVSLVVIAYALNKMPPMKQSDKKSDRICVAIISVFAAAMVVFISVGTIHHHYLFYTGTHDFGLFVQMFHSLADNLTAVTSCERDRFMSHFEIHSSYIFYLLVPIFKLFPYEETLLVAQAMLAMGGIVPFILIAKKRGFTGFQLLLIGAAYVFSTSLIAPCFYDFHENAFLPTLLMWTLWAVDTKKTLPFYIFSVLVCMVKEDAPLFIISIGMYAFFENKGSLKRLHGLFAAMLSGAYMVFITKWLTENGDGQTMTSSRFGHLLLDSDGGIVDVVFNSFSNPGYLLSLLIQEKTLVFLLQVMIPLLFLPFFTKKIHRFLLMIPFIVTNLIIGANYGYAADIGFQYIFGPATLLIFMSLINVNDMTPQMRRNIPVLWGIAALLFFVGTDAANLKYVRQYNEKRDYYIQSEQMLDSIPEDAVIAGNALIISHVCDRDEVYIFDYNDINADKTALIDPERYDFVALFIKTEIYGDAVPLLEEEGFTLWSQSNDHIVIYKSPLYEEATVNQN